MTEDTVVQLRQPGTFSEDPLTEILRLGARRLLAQAVEMEVTAFVKEHADLTNEAGRRRVVRHGQLAPRRRTTHHREWWAYTRGHKHLGRLEVKPA